jgi:hypothetical protein
VLAENLIRRLSARSEPTERLGWLEEQQTEAAFEYGRMLNPKAIARVAQVLGFQEGGMSCTWVLDRERYPSLPPYVKLNAGRCEFTIGRRLL